MRVFGVEIRSVDPAKTAAHRALSWDMYVLEMERICPGGGRIELRNPQVHQEDDDSRCHTYRK